MKRASVCVQSLPRACKSLPYSYRRLPRTRKTVLYPYGAIFHARDGFCTPTERFYKRYFVSCNRYESNYKIMATIGTYTTVDAIPLSRLRNGEFLALVQRTLEFVEEAAGEAEERPGGLSVLAATDSGAPAIGLSAEFVTQLKADADALAERVSETTAADTTPEADTHERNRDALMSFIVARIKQATTVPIAADAEAGNFLLRRISPYQDITRLPVAEETVKIRGFLIDIRKEECTQYVTRLGLEPYLTELETENEAYDTAVKQRTVTRALVVTENTESLRKRMHEEFNVLCLLAQSFAVAVPSDAASTFVRKLNQLIAETNAAYNRRKGHAQSSSEEKPSITNPDDSGEETTDPGTDEERPGGL